MRNMTNICEFCSKVCLLNEYALSSYYCDACKYWTVISGQLDKKHRYHLFYWVDENDNAFYVEKSFRTNKTLLFALKNKYDFARKWEWDGLTNSKHILVFYDINVHPNKLHKLVTLMNFS